MTISNLPTYTTPNSIDRGFVFECCCGERFKNVNSASMCKKCRNYSVWGYTKYVVNIETNEVVYGKMSTDEEYKTQEALAEARWAGEQAACQQEQDEEYLHWEADQAEKAAAAAKLSTETDEDRLWAIQDRLMIR